MDYIDNEQTQKLMPQMAHIDFDQPLADFVDALRTDISNSALAVSLNRPLATGGNRRSYLDLIGKDNSYTDLARRIECAPVSPKKAEAGDAESRKTFATDFVERTHRFIRADYIRTRLKEFEEVRAIIYAGIENMFAQPMFITDSKFGHLVALIEQSKTASIEMHLHFANAFVEAWDHIPHLVLEKVIRADESIKVSKADSTAEIRRQRDRSQGMSM